MDEVDSLLQRRKTRLQYIKYLFKPGELVVEWKDGDIRGFRTNFEFTGPVVQKNGEKRKKPALNYAEALRAILEDAEQHSTEVKDGVHMWKTLGCSWKFDRTFSRVYSTLELALRIQEKQEYLDVDISDLDIFPLAFADESLKQRLEKRGKMFWKCRFQHFVSCNDDNSQDLDSSADERFMIDLMTYRELHEQQSEGQKSHVPEVFKDDLGPDTMKHEDPPDEKFIYLLLSSIKGFNLQRKRWADLQVDKMNDVVWNKKAFKSLVLEHKTKDLIQALISKQLDSEKSTDLIHGKGNGLILLLHAGLGTGKTLTAESVAEIPEKPLYRVTCGDIGTEPEQSSRVL
ncbi:b955f86c-b9d4-4da0-9f5c-cbda508bb4bc [Sclerotinia trifoliorum]|uniref:B955f86c-b9d4-4da0-9f5c-cbda508bb4bc n=1 Tax=Sclerotinia trifoliorum TaxID=28548 RepID=A0A8H2W6Y8_9HELO|nr:b955f86c-b9d4-4da0-9f5c-cbda508bb4bc [Sclerotinia trifoliorum]